MKLIEFFHLTEPDMLLEAAKDRYMQMLPDATIAKFYDVIEAQPEAFAQVPMAKTPKDAKDVWTVEVNWAVQTLKRADRITWYLRMIKVSMLRTMLLHREYHISVLEKDEHGFIEMQNKEIVKAAWEQHNKLSNLISREIQKLDQKSREAGNQVISKAHSEVEAAMERYNEAQQQHRDAPTNNTRSRLTNAGNVYERLKEIETSIQRGLRSIHDIETMTSPGNPYNATEKKTELSHFMTIPDAHIQEYEWGFTPYGALYNMFNFWEHEWALKQDRVIKHDDESWEGAEKIIEFDDGRAWWNLHKSACEREGKAMGHCGNSYRSNRPVEILSLREPEDEGWKVLLTFIWNTENGMVEESKAFDNQKPDVKYHPYILELLSQPFIKGLAQEGTHKPENNFHLSDLEPDTLKELQEINPQLVGATRMEDFINLYGEKPEKDYEDGHGWYRSTRPMGRMDNTHIVYAEPFKSKRGEDYVMIKLTMSFGTHGDINNLSKGDGSKPDHEQKNVIVDALLLDGPKYFSSPRVLDTTTSFHINWLTKEEIMKLAKLKPSYIGAKTQEELAENGYEKAIIKYPESAWLANDEDESEVDLLYVKNWTDVNGQNYLLPVLRGSITRKSLFAMSHPDLYREAFMDTARQKPNREEHAVIKDLLNSEHIDAIKRIGDHSDTFHPDDLDQAEWDEMRERKPSLGGLAYMISKEGMSEKMLNVINSELNDKLDWARSELLKMEDWDEHNKAFRVDGFSPKRLVQDYIYDSSHTRSSDATEQLYKLFSGEGGELFDYFETQSPDSYEAIEILENFQKKDPNGYKKLAKELWEQAAPEEDEFTFEDMDNPRRLYDLIDEYDLGDAKVALASAYTTGLERGAEDDAYEAWTHFWEHLPHLDVVDQYGDEPSRSIYFTLTPGQHCPWCEGSKVNLWFSIAHIADSLEQDDYEAQELMDVENYNVKGIDYPYNGWSGYDQEAAFEHFNEMVWDHVG